MTGARGTAAGAGLAGLTLLALLPLSHSLRTTCAAVLLAVVAGIYVGFAIVDGRPTAILGEAAAVAVAGALVALALSRDSLALVGLGFVLHAGWDLAHHGTGRGRQLAHVVAWYPPFCLTYDVVLGAPLLLGSVIPSS